MNRLNAMAGILCALVVVGLVPSGLARAASYDDVQSGPWDDGDTWGTAPDFPVANDDVIIDRYDVELPMGYVVPPLGSFTISDSGRLWCSASETDCFTIEAAVTMTDGGKIWIQSGGAYIQRGTLKGGLDVSGTVTLRNHDSDCRITIQDNPITNHDATDVIHALGQGLYDRDQGIWLMTPNPSLTAQWQVEKNRLQAVADGGLGTGTITLTNSSLNIKGDQTGSGPSIVVPAGSAARRCGLFLIADDWNSPVNVSWTNSPTLFLTASYVFVRRGSQWNSPIRVGNGTTEIETEWGWSDDNTIIGGDISSDPADGAGAHLLFTYRYQPAPIVLSGDNSGFYGTFETQDTGYDNDDLVFKAESGVGNADRIIVGADTRVLLDKDTSADWTLTNTIAGGGTVQVEDGSGDYKLTVQGGTILPGWSATPLTIDGNLAFAESAKGKATLAAEIQGVWVDDDEDPETPDVLEEIRNRKLAVEHDLTDLPNATLPVTLTELTLTELVDFYGGPPSTWPAFETITCLNDLPTAGERFGTVVFPQGVGGPVTYTYSEKAGTTVTVQLTMPGDADLSGAVDYMDLGILATYYDLSAGWGGGDFTHDGKVDYLDLGILATNYDLTIGSAKGGAAVPAPGAVFLLGFGAVGLLRRRRLR